MQLKRYIHTLLIQKLSVSTLVLVVLCAPVFSAAPVVVPKAHAAFPTVASVTQSTFASDTTSHAVSMPSTVNTGDLLLVLLSTNGTSEVTTPQKWSLAGNDAYDSAIRASVYAKKADGSEGGTVVDFITSGAQQAAAQVYRIPAGSWSGDPVAGIALTVRWGKSVNPILDDTHPSTWGAEDTLWIAYVGAASITSVSSYPTNYTGGTHTLAGSGSTGASVSSAYRQLNAASEKPGSYSVSNAASGLRMTIAIAPAGVTLSGAMRVVLDAYSGTKWTIPDNWNNASNTIEVIGAGGGGGGSQYYSPAGGGGGGGGGAYSKISNVTLTPGATVAYYVSEGGDSGTYSGGYGTAGGSGGDSYFCNSSSNCGSIGSGAVIVGAKGGRGGAAGAGSGGAGGAAGSGVGDVRYSGGSGGSGASGTTASGGGAGGAGGRYGNGNNGGSASGSTAGSGGSGDAGYGGGGGGANSVGDGGSEYDIGIGLYGGAGSGGGGGGGDTSDTNGASGGFFGAGGGGGGIGPSYGGFGAYGVIGIVIITYTLDITAPTPNPMTFASIPTASSTTAITMIANTSTDDYNNVEYKFAYSACGSNAGTGGASSGWQSGKNYTDTGLDVNRCYAYSVQTRDSVGNTSTSSATSSVYTLANAPGTPTLSNQTDNAAIISNNANGNPSNTLFAIEVPTTSPSDSTWNGKYIDASGNPSATAVWLSDATWDGLIMRGLQSNTQYSLRGKAKNGDSIETAWSSTGNTTTANTTPMHVRLFGNLRLFGVRLF